MAVALALTRTLYRKGASFTAAMVFELTSTGLVIDLSIILIVFLGGPVMAAEYLGGIVKIIILVAVFRLTLWLVQLC